AVVEKRKDPPLERDLPRRAVVVSVYVRGIGPEQQRSSKKLRRENRQPKSHIRMAVYDAAIVSGDELHHSGVYQAEEFSEPRLLRIVSQSDPRIAFEHRDVERFFCQVLGVAPETSIGQAAVRSKRLDPLVPRH